MPNNMEVFQTPKGVLFFIDSAINRVFRAQGVYVPELSMVSVIQIGLMTF